MFNDISDHLPIFALCEHNISRYNVKECQFIRKINEDTMTLFSNELSQQTWESVPKTDDVNQAYDSINSILKQKESKMSHTEQCFFCRIVIINLPGKTSSHKQQ